MSAIVEVSGVYKTYRGEGEQVAALQDIHLTVQQGEFVAIMGPSGSGKSTLLHLLGGLDRPDRGQIVIAGTDLTKLNETQLALFRRDHIGFVFQFFNLIANLSVADNVELPGLLGARSSAEVTRRRAELLGTLGISEKARALPGQLSGGQRQRAAIARALINTPALLLGDEPTGNLDSKSGAEVAQLFRQLHQAGQTIIIVTHDPQLASAYADRIVRIADGRLSFQQDSASIPPTAGASGA
jgi:putative ABC transport system ATP-binding protein